MTFRSSGSTTSLHRTALGPCRTLPTRPKLTSVSGNGGVWRSSSERVELAIAVRLSRPPHRAGGADRGGSFLSWCGCWSAAAGAWAGTFLAENRGVLAAVTGFFDGLKLAKAHGLESGHLGSFDGAIVRSRRAQIDYATRRPAAATAVQVVR